MDLTGLLLRVAARRPHSFVVPVAGATRERLAVEAALVRRGWPIATGPADADLLVVAGSPGPELAAVVDRVWQQVPAPRARAEVRAGVDADRELERAGALLADLALQRRRRNRHAHGTRHEDHGSQAAHGGNHGHGGGGMAPAGGLAMADLGDDRDGLRLDRLHVPLGPVLPDWPAGLLVRVVLQGDVIQQASAEVLDAGVGRPFWPTAHPAARELDALTRFLGVAGWADAAARARRLRDELLAGVRPERLAGPAVTLVRHVRRSRILRWSVRGISAGPTDVAGRLEQRLVAIERALASGGPDAVGRPPLHEVAGLLVGAELAAARVIVAALDPDTEGVRHG